MLSRSSAGHQHQAIWRHVLGGGCKSQGTRDRTRAANARDLASREMRGLQARKEESRTWRPPVCFWMLPRRPSNEWKIISPQRKSFPSEEGPKEVSELFPPKVREQLLHQLAALKLEPMGAGESSRSSVGFLSWVFQGIVPQVYELRVEGAQCGVQRPPSFLREKLQVRVSSWPWGAALRGWGSWWDVSCFYRFDVNLLLLRGIIGVA